MSEISNFFLHGLVIKVGAGLLVFFSEQGSIPSFQPPLDVCASEKSFFMHLPFPEIDCVTLVIGQCIGKFTVFSSSILFSLSQKSSVHVCLGGVSVLAFPHLQLLVSQLSLILTVGIGQDFLFLLQLDRPHQYRSYHINHINKVRSELDSFPSISCREFPLNFLHPQSLPLPCR